MSVSLAPGETWFYIAMTRIKLNRPAWSGSYQSLNILYLSTIPQLFFLPYRINAQQKISILKSYVLISWLAGF